MVGDAARTMGDGPPDFLDILTMIGRFDAVFSGPANPSLMILDHR
jgi:hypothetical protein